MFFCYGKNLVFISFIRTTPTDKASDTAVHKHNTREKSHIISNPWIAQSKRENREEEGREDTELNLAVQGKPITIPGVQYS